MKTVYQTILLLILILAICFAGCNYGIANKDKVIKALEKAYFDGQKDALEGDVRIKLTSDSIYIWTKSPWNNGNKPLYNPNYLDSKEK